MDNKLKCSKIAGLSNHPKVEKLLFGTLGRDYNVYKKQCSRYAMISFVLLVEERSFNFEQLKLIKLAVVLEVLNPCSTPKSDDPGK